MYGFDIGADDYVIKPFRNRELISRINNVLRRNNKGKQIKYKDITIDVDSLVEYIKMNKKFYLQSLSIQYYFVYFKTKIY